MVRSASQEPREERRRHVQARQIALSGLGYLSSFTILVLARVEGLANFSDATLAAATAFVGGGVFLLFVLARTGFHRIVAPWDPHWVYVPLMFTAVAILVLVRIAPGIRWVVIHTWLAAVGMCAGYLPWGVGAALTAGLMALYVGWTSWITGTSLRLELIPVLNVVFSSAVLILVSERLRSGRREVRALTERLQTANQRLAELAVRDPLTEAFNRRYLEEQLALEVERSQRSCEPLTVGMIDLDGFKHYNDTYGHLKGDELLRRAAQTLRACVRSGDVVARYGGDEFVVVLVGVKRGDASAILGRIRNALGSLPLPEPQGSRGITASVGGACYPEDGVTSEALLRSADEALYRAKQQGGNQVVFAEGERCRSTTGAGKPWGPEPSC